VIVLGDKNSPVCTFSDSGVPLLRELTAEITDHINNEAD